MAIQFVPGQVAVSDTNPGGPTPLSNMKDVNVKVVKLTSANFKTGGQSSLVAMLPADSTIIELSLWKKTQLSGNGITAATLSLGTAASGTQFANAYDAFTPAAGAQSHISPVTNIMQAYDLPLGVDINIWATGTATTGNPTAGEIYLKIVFVR